ncbi:hypothetical protein K6H11_001311 [Candida tropicalis]
MSTISNQSQPRRVARRACLSCREKKIKCDGEPMITVTGADGTNKIIPERTRTCSNCRFLDIECVFVQSNRGGKRKKRDPDSTDLDPDIKKSKSLHLNQYDHEQSQASPPAQQQQQQQQNNDVSSSAERLSSYISDGKIPKKLPSPVFSQATLDYQRSDPYKQNQFPRSVSSFSSLSGPSGTLLQLPNRAFSERSNSINYSGLPPFPPQHLGSSNSIGHLPSITQTSPHQQPHPPPPPKPHSGSNNSHHSPHLPHPPPPPTTSSHHSMEEPPRGPPPPLPPHLLHHYYGYPPPPPPPHMHHPPGFGFPPPPPPPGIAGGPHPPPPPGQPYHYGPPPQGPPPHMNHQYERHHSHHHHHHHQHLRNHSGSHRSHSKNHSTYDNESSRSRGPPSPSPPSNLSRSSSSSSLSNPNDVSMAGSSVKISNAPQKPIYMETPSVKLPPPPPNEKKLTLDAPFTDEQLAKYDLPPWEVLNKVFNYYYIYNHPGHQLFPGKSIFIKNLALVTDASIIHAIIATTCLIVSKTEPSLGLVGDELYWLNKMHKYWDNLNDMGILCCYKLMSKCTSIRFNVKKINDLNIKLWETVNNNQYVEIYKQKRFEFQESRTTPTFGTKRQNFEREMILKIIWSFYINNIILLRFHQGRPYYKLSSILDGFKFDYERDLYSNNILLPMGDTDYISLKLVNNRSNWSQLYEKNTVPSDSTSLILAAKSFEHSLSKLSNEDLKLKDLIQPEQSTIEFKKKIKNLYSKVLEDKKLVVINMSYWFSNIILCMGDILEFNYFLQDVMVFKMCKYDFNANNDSNDSNHNATNDPWATSGVGVLQNPLISSEISTSEGLTDKLQELSTEQWKCLLQIIKSIHEYVDFLKLVPSSEYEKDFLVVVGPTALDDYSNDAVQSTKTFRDVIDNSSDWWDTPELQSTVKQAWTKMPVYVLSFTAGILSLAYSLAVLTKYLKIHKSGSNELVVEFIEISLKKHIPEIKFETKEDELVLELFNQSSILSQLSTLCEFVKFKLNYSNEEIMTATTQRLNKLNQNLDDILVNKV